jgi:hypothetical protein
VIWSSLQQRNRRLKMLGSTGGKRDDTGAAIRLANPFFDGVALGRIIAFDGSHPVIAGSPLTPSQPGCAGDTGWIGEKKVVDVVRERRGLLHVIEGEVKLGSTIGDLVLVRRNTGRRERLERTHAATVLVLAALISLGVEVQGVEVLAGAAWIELIGPAPKLDLSALTAPALPLEAWPQRSGRMLVRVGERNVTTYFAPISQSTDHIGTANLRAVTAQNDGHEALEVRLADEEGQSWWL